MLKKSNKLTETLDSASLRDADHVLDVYDHCRWRYVRQQKHDQAWNGLKTDDSWQDKYFSPTDPARKEFQFWFG